MHAGGRRSRSDRSQTQLTGTCRSQRHRRRRVAQRPRPPWTAPARVRRSNRRVGARGHAHIGDDRRGQTGGADAAQLVRECGRIRARAGTGPGRAVAAGDAARPRRRAVDPDPECDLRDRRGRARAVRRRRGLRGADEPRAADHHGLARPDDAGAPARAGLHHRLRCAGRCSAARRFRSRCSPGRTQPACPWRPRTD